VHARVREIEHNRQPGHQGQGSSVPDGLEQYAFAVDLSEALDLRDLHQMGVALD
jgi:hypothetical protein